MGTHPKGGYSASNNNNRYMLIDNIIVRITSQMEGRYMPPKKKTKLREVLKRRGGTPSHHCSYIPPLHCDRQCCCPCAVPVMKFSHAPDSFAKAAKRRERVAASGDCFSRVSTVAELCGHPRPSGSGKQDQTGEECIPLLLMESLLDWWLNLHGM